MLSDREIVVDEKRPQIAIGRADENDVVIRGNLISRIHARIEISRNKFLLIDQSTNGTFVKAEDGEESFVRRDSMQLKGSGMIGLGKVPEAGNRRRRSVSSAKKPDQARLASGGAGSAQALLHAVEFRVHGLGRALADTRPGRRGCPRASLRQASCFTLSSSCEHFRADVQALHVEVLRARQVADGGFLRAGAAGAALEHPRQHAQVVAEARPQELAVGALAEPVDVEDLRRVS